MKDDIALFEATLQSGGLAAALRHLNSRTAHRFTGVYRYDGPWLRNVALVDRWNPELIKGDDAPMRETFCAIVPTQGNALEVLDGKTDSRFPWMNDNAVIRYCGALIRDADGEPYGTVCHFDVNPCDAATREFPLLQAAAPMLYRLIATGAPN